MGDSFNDKTNKDKPKLLPTKTPGTIESNKQKLQRGVSRETEFANGTLLNFGNQSTRSTFLKTPLMFGQNAHAKLHKIPQGCNHGPAQNSQYSGITATNGVFSPPQSNNNYNTNNITNQKKPTLSPLSGSHFMPTPLRIPSHKIIFKQRSSAINSDL